MPGHFYVNGGFGYGEENDPAELQRLHEILAENDFVKASYPQGEGPPYMTTELQSGLHAFQDHAGIERTDKVPKDSPTVEALNDLIDGKPKAARLARLSFPRKFRGTLGDGYESDPKAAADLATTLHVLGKTKQRPRDPNYDFFRREHKDALEAFQAEHRLPKTGRVKAGDATHAALVTAVDILLDDNKVAIADYTRRAAHNRVAARIMHGSADLSDDRPRGESASFGADDFSGYDEDADTEKQLRVVPMPPFPDPRSYIFRFENTAPNNPPDTYFEPDEAGPKRVEAKAASDAESATKYPPSFWDQIVGPDPGSERNARSAGAVPRKRGFRPDEDDPARTTPDSSALPDREKPQGDDGSVTLAQNKGRPLTDNERKNIDERIKARLKAAWDKEPDAIRSDLRRVEIATEVLDAEGVMTEPLAHEIWRAIGSRDSAARVRALIAMSQAARRFPDAATRYFNRGALMLANEIGRLHDDPNTPDDLKDDPAALERKASQNTRIPNINAILNEYGVKVSPVAAMATAAATRRKKAEQLLKNKITGIAIEQSVRSRLTEDLQKHGLIVEGPKRVDTLSGSTLPDIRISDKRTGVVEFYGEIKTGDTPWRSGQRRKQQSFGTFLFRGYDDGAQVRMRVVEPPYSAKDGRPYEEWLRDFLKEHSKSR